MFFFIFVFRLGLRRCALRRNADLHRRVETLASATASAATTAATSLLSAALAVALTRRELFLADDDRVGLRFAFDFRNERTILRFFLFADRRNPDRRTSLLLRCRFFGQFAQLLRFLG